MRGGAGERRTVSGPAGSPAVAGRQERDAVAEEGAGAQDDPRNGARERALVPGDVLREPVVQLPEESIPPRSAAAVDDTRRRLEEHPPPEPPPSGIRSSPRRKGERLVESPPLEQRSDERARRTITDSTRAGPVVPARVAEDRDPERETVRAAGR